MASWYSHGTIVIACFSSMQDYIRLTTLSSQNVADLKNTNLRSSNRPFEFTDRPAELRH
jgi:hypothetical protein